MSADFPRIPAAELKSFMKDMFIHLGVPADEAEVCATVLITSDLRGIESHGIGRLKMYYDRMRSGQQEVKTTFEVVRDHAATAVVDGHNGVGMVIAAKAMQMAIDKAKIYGMGSVAVRNSNHFGIDGYYALMAVKENMVGMSFTNARPSISPTFSIQPKLGTNPIAFGAPTDEDIPFLFDAATSIVQRGKVEVYDRIQKTMPEGWVVDPENQSLTDPTYTLKALGENKAALLPLGGEGESLSGYKGYGLATMVEIFSAAFQSANFLSSTLGLDKDGKSIPFGLGHFFMAIDIQSFTDIDTFKKNTGDILRELRQATPAPGYTRIYTSGEKEYENEQRLAKEGIEIIPELQKQMKQIQSELNLSQYHLPF